jgi:hypothetical protein
LDEPEDLPKKEFSEPVVLENPDEKPKKELKPPVVLLIADDDPKKVFCPPVVFLRPESNPKKVLVLILLILIWLVTVPALELKEILALDVEITLIDKIIVPLKSVVGVITSVPVVVAIGPTAPVAVKSAKD